MQAPSRSRLVKLSLALGLLLVVGAGCTRTKVVNDLPNATPVATVTLADHGVGLLTQTISGEPCFELRADVAEGFHGPLVQYGCLQPRDQLDPEFLINNGQLAVGGAVGPSVATVTVNNQPTYRDGPYFLAVLPTIPDGDVDVVASDKDDKVVLRRQYPRALVTSRKMPSSATP